MENTNTNVTSTAKKRTGRKPTDVQDQSEFCHDFGTAQGTIDLFSSLNQPLQKRIPLLPLAHLLFC